MSCNPFEWICARCGKAWPDSYHVSYPRIFWKDNKKQTGDVCEKCLTCLCLNAGYELKIKELNYEA